MAAFCAAAGGDSRPNGITRNLDNGQVEVFAVGKADKLAELEGWLWKGPAFSDVRGVEAKEDVVERFSTFQIER